MYPKTKPNQTFIKFILTDLGNIRSVIRNLMLFIDQWRSHTFDCVFMCHFFQNIFQSINV